SYMLVVATLIFVYNFFKSRASGPIASNDPWGAPTLEWSIPSPPPDYNFAQLPTVTSRYPLWDMKSPALTAEVPHTTEGDKATRGTVAGADTGVDVELGGAPRSKAPSEGPMHQEHGYRTAKELGIPMPNPSIMPLVVATAIVIGFSGMLFLGREDKTLA